MPIAGVSARGGRRRTTAAHRAVHCYGFVLTPVQNTITRTMEAEADAFGLNAAREPDGFAQAALHLSEYRKMRPGALEEFIFFDHPERLEPHSSRNGLEG